MDGEMECMIKKMHASSIGRYGNIHNHGEQHISKRK
jgi:hypothetical protein